MICRLCGLDKPDEQFALIPSSGNRRKQCYSCRNAKYPPSAEAKARANQKFAESHPHYAAMKRREYYAENPRKILAYNAARYKRVRLQTPRWADLEAIRRFYEACPPGFHVDHIVPLHGLSQSGLHVRENLQYLPAVENCRKGNRV